MGPEVTGPARPPTLELLHLSKHFGGEQALGGVNFTVLPGEVHGLLGHNGSGKSTLIKVLAGLHAPDPGAELIMNGQSVALPMRPGAFRTYGLSFVHQHLALVPSLTVTENLLAGRYATQERLWLSPAAEHREAGAVLRQFGLELDPQATVDQLTPVARAQLAIVRAVQELPLRPDGTQAGGLLVLDEPTPFLPRREVERLFSLVRRVVARGASVILVSHDVDEVLEITDRATILRDGRVAGTFVTRDTNKVALVEAIIGRPVESQVRREAFRPLGTPRLTVRGAGGQRCHDVDLDVAAGEIVGLTGLVGSGYDELPYLLYGAGRNAHGSLTLEAQTRRLERFQPSDALSLGMVLIPADRGTQSAMLDLSVLDNLTGPLLTQTWRGWSIGWAALRTAGQRLVREFQVKPAALDVPISTLSGGNQQKVVLAKWLQTNPQVILLDEPTQGVDVGAREEVYAAIRAAATAGASVLCASSDHEQLAVLCHRVLVFGRGTLVAALQGDEVEKHRIARHCYEQAEVT